MILDFRKREGEPYQEPTKKIKRPVEHEGESSRIQQDTGGIVSISSLLWYDKMYLFSNK